MVTLSGRGASGGIVTGTVRYYARAAVRVYRREVEDPDPELRRFERARGIAVRDLARLCLSGKRSVGEDGSLIFRVHQMMLEDPEYCAAVRRMIREEHVNAEYAVSTVTAEFARMIGREENGYISSRATDLRDAAGRILSILSGQDQPELGDDGPFILAAEDLSPSETVRMDRRKVLAFITAGGSRYSHTAILARTMGIPAVIGVSGVCKELDGQQARVDGFTGEICIAPDEQTIRRFREYSRRHDADEERLQCYRDRKTATADGRRIRLCANISTPEEVEVARQNGAEGIGLFRSEFLYLAGGGYPSEAYQFSAYRRILEAMAGRRVVIRTLDLGADKRTEAMDLNAGMSLGLGPRGIRLCLNCPELFRPQLRALCRASVYGHLAVLLPMVTSTREITQVRDLLRGIRADLDREGIRYSDDMELGVMIETPAAAILSDQLAQEADFFSIGTNDLTQYTLALDRQDSRITALVYEDDTAVMRLIALTAEHAHRAGIPVGICGEMAGSAERTAEFLRLGIDELSLPPHAILPLREKICAM